MKIYFLFFIIRLFTYWTINLYLCHRNQTAWIMAHHLENKAQYDVWYRSYSHEWFIPLYVLRVTYCVTSLWKQYICNMALVMSIYIIQDNLYKITLICHVIEFIGKDQDPSSNDKNKSTEKNIIQELNNTLDLWIYNSDFIRQLQYIILCD